MGRRTGDRRKQIVDLLQDRPGWRLEPRTTPGASPLWCFVSDGNVECSVAVEGNLVHLYLTERDRELTFEDAAALAAWLQGHKADALGAIPDRIDRRARLRKLFEWS